MCARVRMYAVRILFLILLLFTDAVAVFHAFVLCVFAIYVYVDVGAHIGVHIVCKYVSLGDCFLRHTSTHLQVHFLLFEFRQRANPCLLQSKSI
jgi:hypothetical protein